MTDHKTDKRAPKDVLDWLGLRRTPDFARARWFGAGFTVVLILLFMVALTAAVMVLVHTIGQVSSPEAEGPNLGVGALIAALLGAPFLIWATVIKQTTLNFQKEGHITDRISKAVEQLGAEKTLKMPKDNGEGTVERTVPNIEVRIGGLLGLERIAQDSTRYDNGRDHVRVMEILCAYVRENAPCLTLTLTEPLFTAKKTRIDVQTAINVIKRRDRDQRAIEDLVRYRLDLRSVDFDGADMSKGNFAGAIFWRSRFEAANFETRT